MGSGTQNFTPFKLHALDNRIWFPGTLHSSYNFHNYNDVQLSHSPPELQNESIQLHSLLLDSPRVGANIEQQAPGTAEHQANTHLCLRTSQHL